MPDYLRIYSKQEYLTPGAARTVEMISDAVEPGEETWLLDVAGGKGEAAATLASHYACNIVAVEPYVHPRSDWEDYWKPMLEVAQEAKVAQPADIDFADEVESGVAVERRAVDAWLDYVTFVARKAVD